ncbi:DUF1007 family protein [Sulfitobacter mediterraneus]|jgi:ABC-type uncharacterized transport system substrate-binding protein|uniref:DUF1007 family protein n=1 Tax=Sulfitobacter TaxID=60136 RepID=UPI00193189F7|nr:MULTISPECIES: DUF1007 family protein [Sulfitobacter]MBM1632764.1 DUF1007 family protein [Sulfitobacter mediterraneus]MBM1641102.1 DUF1007 family protein [Sulfitobacter mediterraneus]MBM1644629.1 DUF1007 family protein [Sulfitobacter mediterraneus]MBM1649222.1 DUF1007 family protein [Sulfitobacter mediterraneus]MBM1653243.1 DUF1007 family protein [Sulfitobacter mediterraneus]
MKRIFPLLMALVIAQPLGAHPHVFIDTGLALDFGPEGRLQRVKVTWIYDAFYSLLITQDMELDPDGDGILSPAEQSELIGFDMQWVEGFNGDLVITQAGQELALSGPQDVGATFENGQIITTHWRDVTQDQPGSGNYEITPYDASYYTAYEVTQPVQLSGADQCRSRIAMPDITADLDALRQELFALDRQTQPEDAGLPDIGAKFATKVIVTCASS